MALALPSNSKTWLERVSKDKPSSLLGFVVSDEGKKFYNIDTQDSLGKEVPVTDVDLELELPARFRCLPSFMLAQNNLECWTKPSIYWLDYSGVTYQANVIKQNSNNSH